MFFCDSPNATGSVETLDEQTETESVVSFRRERPRHREGMEQHGEGKIAHGADDKKEIMAAFQTPQQCKEADRTMLISKGRLSS